MSRNRWSFILLIGLLLFLSAAAPPADPPAPAFIHLQYATFDPLQNLPAVPANLSAARTAPDVPGLFIVQFNDSIQPEWRTALENLGADIENYLPDNAFLVRLTPTAARTAAQMDNVRWVGDFQPAYKLSPRLNTETSRVRIALASWANTAAVKNQLTALGLTVGGDNGVLIASASVEQLSAIAQLPDVLWVEPFFIPKILNDQATGIMNVQPAWNLGYTGAGQTVTIADTGLDTGVDDPSVNGDIHLDFDNRVTHLSSWAVQNYSGISNVGADDGASDLDSGHGTHVAGSVGGNGARSSGTIRGAAYEADITFQAVEQWTTFSDGSSSYQLTGIPSDITQLFLEAYGWGSRVHTNSWGSDESGAYTTDSQNADQFIWNHKDFTILFAAGNAGTDNEPGVNPDDNDGYVNEDSLNSPGTAKNVITVGASENVRSSGGYQSSYGSLWPSDFATNPTRSDVPSNSAEEMAAFSSRGPTDDGRIKPDLVAPGTNILSTRSSQISGHGWGPYTDDYYMYMGGTSMATPLVAGAVTVVRDYLVNGEGIANPTAALIKALLINSAEDISGYGDNAQEAGQPIPNMHEGWGRINVGAAVSATNRALYNDVPLANGGSRTYPFTVTGTVDALKATLVWSDYPGTPASNGALVNNLNLIVTAPNGSTTYLGNHFSGGWSTTGGFPDTVNNVENVYIQNPVTGTWTIEVDGVNIPQGPQPFALVVSGATAPPQPPLTYVYLPLILKNAGGTAPTAGFWQSTSGDEFYVTTDQSSVDDFAIHINVDGCGSYKITHLTPEAISNHQFAFTGSFYASGTFNDATSASGTDGLDNFYISGCGYINGGPWSWNATWQNSSQPRISNATVIRADDGQPQPRHSDVTVTQLP